MTDLFKKITDSRGLLENLVSKIPGFWPGNWSRGDLAALPGCGSRSWGVRL